MLVQVQDVFVVIAGSATVRCVTLNVPCENRFDVKSASTDIGMHRRVNLS